MKVASSLTLHRNNRAPIPRKFLMCINVKFTSLNAEVISVAPLILIILFSKKIYNYIAKSHVINTDRGVALY